jgi:excisionase family DNA binding protein
MKPILTPGEVARRAGVTREMVLIWVRQGRLQAHRTESGRHFFEETEVVRFLKDRERRRASRAVVLAAPTATACR